MIDSHAHLWYDRFDPDRDEVLDRARSIGLQKLIVVGVDLASSRASRDLASRSDLVAATAGVHPNDCGDWKESDWQDLEDLLDEGGFCAVGETGLDLYWKRVALDRQIEALSRQIEMARHRNLPVILHCRDAAAELLGFIESLGRPLAGVMHCFSGSRTEMERALALGLDISFAGPVTYPRNTELREAARVCPPDRIHVETDCPFLPPQGRRGGRNEPAFVLVVIEELARIRGSSPAAFGAQVAANSRRLFALDGV